MKWCLLKYFEGKQLKFFNKPSWMGGLEKAKSTFKNCSLGLKPALRRQNLISPHSRALNFPISQSEMKWRLLQTAPSITTYHAPMYAHTAECNGTSFILQHIRPSLRKRTPAWANRVIASVWTGFSVFI